MVTGEPGVGKTRLTDAAPRAAEVPETWLQARCLSYGTGLAYWPYAELLRAAGIRPDTAPDEASAGPRPRSANERCDSLLRRLLGLPTANR